jgi:hypothetical protein
MQITEFRHICRSITGAVATWLSHQGQITRAIHRIIVQTIQMESEAPPLFVIQDLHDEYPEGLDYCETAIAFRAVEILNAEFKPLSRLFSELYQDFNRRFFDGSLRPTSVRVMHNLPLPERPFTAEDVCAGEIREGLILMHYNGWPDDMVVRLVHLMAHVQTGRTHGVEFEMAMANAQRLGAPSADAGTEVQPSNLATHPDHYWTV